MQTIPPTGVRRVVRGGFTLIELLVVITIIALIATIGLPALKGFGKSNAITATDRQLLDDIGAARQRAIAEHTTVYVLFASPAVLNVNWSKLTDSQREQVTNIARGQFTSYAFFANRSVGDQPGQKTKRYLSKWKTLPDGLLIATNKYLYNDNIKGVVDGITYFETNGFPFPSSTNDLLNLPYLAFNHLGQLVNARDDGAEVLPIGRGSIFYADPNNRLAADVLETPPGNSRTNQTTWHHIRIDGLTGRARVEQYQIPDLQ